MSGLNEREDAMKLSKLILGIAITLVVSVFGYLYFIEGTYAETITIGVQEIEVFEESVMLKGGTSNSATGFSKYTYYIEDENLYIKLKYSVVSKVNPTGNYKITIYEPTNDIYKIYMQGRDKNDNRLIWEKK